MKRFAQHKRILLLILILSLFTVGVYQIATLESFQHFKAYLQHNAAIYMPLLVLIKIIAVLYPPLPGMAATAGSVVIFGWKTAYILDFIGSTVGATGAYFLGKRYGKSLLHWVVGEKITRKVTSVKVRQNNQIETAFMLRIASGGVLSDALAWGASLIHIKYTYFMIAYIASHMVTSFPIFFLLGQSSEIKSVFISLPIILFVWVVLYKFKGRYFE